jgi:hypothetical protein
MTKNIERESLISALSYCSLRDLPEKDSGENVWLRSLAKVQKSDGSESYVLLCKDEKGNERMVKDFGNIAAVRKVVEYYPFEYLMESYMPKFKTAKKEERIAFLSKYDKETDYSKFTAKQLDEAVMNVAMKTQLNK